MITVFKPTPVKTIARNNRLARAEIWCKCPTSAPNRNNIRSPVFVQKRTAGEGTMNRQRDLRNLFAEVAAVRDRAERVCRETQALRNAYRLAIERTRWIILRSGREREPVSCQPTERYNSK